MSQLVGIDEVGRGSWAGPLLVVAARFNNEAIEGLKDSKLLSKKRREFLYEQIKQACSFGEGWATPKEIDVLGLSGGMRVAVERALIALGSLFDEEIIIDGNVNYCPERFTNSRCLINADTLLPIVSAASIVAKVRRDRYMERAAEIFPGYGFERHVGYGTKVHHDALKLQGLTAIHRLSFKPMKSFQGSL